MSKRLRGAGEEIVGWGLLGVAVLILPLPLVPSLALIASLLILSSRYQWAHDALVKTRRTFRFPFAGQPVKKSTAQQL